MAYAIRQRTGTAAIVAIIVAIVSIIATFSGHAVWGLLLGLIAIVSGGVGMVTAASPRVSGGAISIAAIVLAIFGLGLSILGMLGAALF